MVSQVGLNTSVGTALQPMATTAAQTTGTNQSLFTNYSSNPTNDYSNDIMMQGLNFGQLATAINQNMAAQTQQQETAQLPAQTEQQNLQPSFSGGAEASQTQETETPQAATTEDEPKGSNIAKILGAATGLVAPLVPKAFKLLKGGSVKELFKLKELAVACPVFGVVGLGMGMLLDSCIDSQKAKSQNEQSQAQQQEIIQNFLNGRKS